MSEVEYMEQLLESEGYDCVSDPVDKDAVFCFDAGIWFYNRNEVLDWLKD